jgi:protein-S-isoprenylcysteine O-methyltransferase Ste14
VTLKQDHELVETGPYRWIRHPIYTGILLAFAGSALARAEWRGLLALLIATAALARKIRIEERWLTELFGARYQDYSRRSWALFPGLW